VNRRRQKKTKLKGKTSFQTPVVDWVGTLGEERETKENHWASGWKVSQP